jgi:hypothetical protein
MIYKWEWTAFARIAAGISDAKNSSSVTFTSLNNKSSIENEWIKRDDEYMN